MQRDLALQDLSRDHFFTLGLARRLLRRGVGGPHGREVDEVGAELLVAWDQDLLWHFREEEDVLLPLLARHLEPCSVPEVRRMLDDHFWIRNAINTVRDNQTNVALEGDQLSEIGRRLHDHVRLEERQVFPILERLLTKADLRELGEGSTSFRSRWRTEDVIGPNRHHG